MVQFVEFRQVKGEQQYYGGHIVLRKYHNVARHKNILETYFQDHFRGKNVFELEDSWNWNILAYMLEEFKRPASRV